MTERHKDNKQQSDQRTNDPGRPSQAEGERETVDQDQGKQRGRKGSGGQQTNDPGRPSQAEGDRETVDQDLREKKR